MNRVVLHKILAIITVIFCMFLSGCKATESESSHQPEFLEYTTSECNVSYLQGAIQRVLKKDAKIYAGVYQKGVKIQDGRYAVVIYDTIAATTERTILQGPENMAMLNFALLEEGNYKGLFVVWDADNNKCSSICLSTFDQSGSMLETVDITEELHEKLATDIVTLNSFTLDAKGNLYFYTTMYGDVAAGDYSIESKIYVVDEKKQIQLIKELSDDVLMLQEVDSQIWLATGRMEDAIVCYNLSNTEEKEPMDLKLNLPAQNFEIAEGLEENQKFIIQSGSVYEYRMDSGKMVKLFDYEDIGLKPGTFNTSKPVATGQDEFYVAKNIGESEAGVRIYDLVKITKSENTSPKDILTIAVLEENALLKEAVVSFNQTSEQYKAVIKVYGDGEKETANDLLQADIAAGNIPDMIAMDVIDLDAMINKGLLCDLHGLLESDGDLSKNDFVGRSLEIYERGDKLYGIPETIGIVALSGKEKLLEGKGQWNIAEFQEFIQSLPDKSAATKGISKADMLQIIMEQNMAEFVDWETRTCSFESDTFKELLQFVNMYPDEGLSTEANLLEYAEMFHEDEIVLYPNSICDVSGYSFMKALWGEEVAYVGYPTANRNGIQMTDVGNSYVITEKSANKEEIWKILKHMITNPKLAEMGLPSYKPSFESACEKAMERNMVEEADGSIVEAPIMELEVEDMVFEIFASTKEEVDKVRNLCETAVPMKNASPKIKNIIMEEAVAYFNGQKTIDEVVGVIQNRAMLYLNE